MAADKERSWRISRRDFLGVAWGVSIVALISQAGASLLDFFEPRIQPGSFGGEVVAGALEEFEPGSVSYVQNGRFYLVRLEDGGVLALWQRCPHLGCTVPWREGENRFNCPCHSSLFNITGEVTDGPSPRPMDLFPVSLREGKLIVDTGQPIERQDFNESQVFYPTQ